MIFRWQSATSNASGCKRPQLATGALRWWAPETRSTMAAPLPGPYEGRRHEVFVCHAGDESKEVVAWPFKRALEARSQLKVFVDEADLRPGAPSIENIKAALANCKVAVVVFGPRFFESQYCLEELEMVVELGQVQCKFIYLPVFLWLTVGEVKERALDHGGRNFADRVVRTTGIRHQGDIISGRDKMVDETVNQVCNQVQNMLEAASAQGPAIITPTNQAMSNILGLGCILYKGEFESGTFHPQRPETLQSRIAQAVTQWRV
ncbi:hypothetical protein WJX72_005460 [[Myrmecia] bisecta]|uniref:TIR domain-containing protein n=1 Tax=[Myrmecia] bisecta TaxID=41462 RepID=A0AAW1R6Y4_9CHLO